MPEFTGYWLDEYTFLCPAVDKNDPYTVKWCMMKTALPRNKNGTIEFDPVSGKYYDLIILDNDEFEWKGMKCKICTGEAN